MADIYGFGPGWDLPATAQSNVKKLIADYLKANPPVGSGSNGKGTIPDGTDFNTIRTPGVYSVPTTTNAGTMINCPTRRAGILRVDSNTDSNITIQSYQAHYTTSEAPESYLRSTFSSSPTDWSPWSSQSVVQGILKDGTNLQSFREQGVWIIPTTTNASTILDLPVALAGTLEVYATRETSRSMQRFTIDKGTGIEEYTRVGASISTMPAWQLTSGAVTQTVINSNSAFVGADGRLYGVVAGVMRNPAGTWEVLDDAIHRHANVEAVTTSTKTIDVKYPGLKAQKVVSWVCTPDEQLTKAGYACAASVSLTEASITVARYQPVADYVQYNTTNGWSSLNGVFRNFSFANGTLTMDHDSVGGDNFMDFQVTGRGGCLVSSSAQAGGSTQTVTKIDFRDYSGALIASPTADMKAYISRGSSGPVDPAQLTLTRYPASNIWFQGIFELGSPA